MAIENTQQMHGMGVFKYTPYGVAQNAKNIYSAFSQNYIPLPFTGWNIFVNQFLETFKATCY